MVTNLIQGLWTSAKQRFLSPVPAQRKRVRANQRALRLESLEGRELLAVAVVDRSWKEFEFTGPVVVTGTLSGRYGTSPVSGKFNGNLNISGDMQYSSPNDAVGEGSVVGTVNSMVYGYGNLPTLNLNGNTADNAVKEVAGKFSAVLPGGGALSPVTLGGTLSTKDFKASGSINFTLSDTVKGTGTWTGTFAPVDPQPLNVTTSASWDPVKPGVIDVHIDAAGSVQKAVNRNTAVANVTMYWGNAAGTKLAKLTDTIPVLWNQAGGNYEVSKLAVPPATATQIIFVTTYGTTTKQSSLDLPARPTITVSNASVTPPATGFGDMVFNVSISQPTAFPVTVKFTTANGTAVRGQDYTNRNGTLTFVPGGPTTQTVIIKVKKDTTVANQDFYLQLSSPTWGTLAGNGRGIGSIIDIPAP